MLLYYNLENWHLGLSDWNDGGSGVDDDGVGGATDHDDDDHNDDNDTSTFIINNVTFWTWPFKDVQQVWPLKHKRGITHFDHILNMLPCK